MGSYTMRVSMCSGLQTMAQIREALGNADFVNMTPPCGEERVITILTTEKNAEKLAVRGCKTEKEPPIA
jgi:hypothetical protein